MTSLAIIGGSGAYNILGREALGRVKTLKPVRTPFGKRDNIHKARMGGRDVLFLSRHGEDGYRISAPFINYRANIWALKELGVERIIAWSGPGVINPSFSVGGYTVPHDIIDMTKRRPSTFFEKGGLGFIRMKNPFCQDLRHALMYAMEEDGLRYYDESVYLCTEGPRLETPAEIRLFHSYGADLVGMTLVPEAFLARELEMCYAALCYLTNYAEGAAERAYREGELFEGMQSAREKEDVEEAMERLPRLAAAALAAAAAHERECECKDAMLRYKKRGDITDDWRKWIDP
ncbi:MAG: MTAP family purine nucleoside phosphorylase [Candidatus Nitrospinota bacterium M3_3B_026]